MSPQKMGRLSFCIVVILAVAAFVCGVSGDDGRRELARGAREILKRRCFECHGANGVARKNVFVLERDRLVAARTVIPEDTNSLLLNLVDSGAMPVGGPQLPKSERDALRNWIAAGAPDWDDAAVQSERSFLTENAILALILKDLQQSPERNRIFLRYFSLAHLYNAGVQDAELEVYRAAVTKLVNSLSWHREITPVASIDAARTIFRVDLRDYNWTAATWNLLLAAYPYGVRGAESHSIERLSGATLPYVRADWFVANASVPPLYHDILSLPRTSLELEGLLGIDVHRDLLEEKNVARAGLRSSGVSQNNRALERHLTPIGAYWKSFDFKSNLDDENVFKNPLRLNPAGGEIIFNLPNGLQAYFLINAFGRRIDDAPIAIVADRNNTDDPVIHNGRSCMSCHYDGIKKFKDDVRPVVRGLAFGSFDREKALAIYPVQEKLDRLIEADRDRFQKAAQRACGVAINAHDEPVSALTRRFRAEITLAQAAAEAGLKVGEFQDGIAKSARLLALGYGQLLVTSGGFKRDAWDKNFGDLVRELGLGEHIASVIVLPVGTAPGSQLKAPAAGRAGATIGAPASIMRSARTITVRSMTIYLEPELLENELLKRPEFKSMDLVIVKDERMADIRIDINRAAFSFKYSYIATNPQTSVILASGAITAWNGDFAAPRIAKELLKEILAARAAQE